MLKIQEFMCALEEFAPLALSRKRVEAGDYDNSGLLVDAKRDVQRVLFSLDLTAETAARAAKLKCDTVVTHHPAIYGPLSRITAEDPVFFAIRHGLNVISMHLNLDYAPGGTDESLAQVLGAESNGCRITENEGGGYGREFAAEERVRTDICPHCMSFVDLARAERCTDRSADATTGQENVCLDRAAQVSDAQAEIVPDGQARAGVLSALPGANAEEAGRNTRLR